jgi:hypothetical protein
VHWRSDGHATISKLETQQIGDVDLIWAWMIENHGEQYCEFQSKSKGVRIGRSDDVIFSLSAREDLHPWLKNRHRQNILFYLFYLLLLLFYLNFQWIRSYTYTLERAIFFSQSFSLYSHLIKKWPCRTMFNQIFGYSVTLPSLYINITSMFAYLEWKIQIHLVYAHGQCIKMLGKSYYQKANSQKTEVSI